ncbi:amino acid adenylation domain-containing protein [Pantanalinema rosaneae CENA516]|uniref:amino acid adenylation domain-containing protein n=1 Tax=Pantanalinema rosaneae TaxID=1620701 RepID=UPI003D6EF6EE
MNHLSHRIAALTPEQQALLKQRLSQKPNQGSHAWGIPKRPRSPEAQIHLPVSFAQQRMWFQDQLGRNSAVSNNIAISLRITGSLQVNALEQSLKAILQRHEVLRTTLHVVNGELTQVINSIDHWKLAIVDLQTLSNDQQALEVQRLATAQACQPFNLATDLLLRATLLTLNATEHILLLILHHVAADAWSIGVFFRELSALYAAFSTGQPSPLAALPIQYADFAVWQRQTLQGDLLAEDLAYWQQKLHQATDLLLLPSDRPRPALQSFTGRTQSFLLPKPLTEALKDLSHRAEATLFMTLLAALQTLLFRYTDQDDILVGTPIANRQQPEIEPLIGCFINTLVLRTDLSGNPSFQTLLQQVRTTVLEALAHQTVPFEKLVDELQLARNLTYAPLFQVMLVLQNAFSIENIELPGLQVEHERIDNYTAQFDLTFHLVEADTGLIGKLEYNTDLFDESTIDRLIGHFQTLLTSIVAHPDQRLAELPLLTPTEQLQLHNWNQTTTDYPAAACIHHLFELQVQKTPDAIAVIQGEQQITYRELNQRANQLAHYLQKIGIQPEALVGICVDRSITMMVGLLGILKAGGVYVPLDPGYPTDRLELILTDAQAAVLLTQQSLAAKLPKLTTTTIFLDTDWHQITHESVEPVASPVHPHNLAYIIYTSGSTGKPKGVMIEHQSLVNYTEAAIANYDIGVSDRVLQFASISFDAAAEEIFPCLAQGATLVLRTDTMLSSMAMFLQACADWQLTVLDLPTAFWHQLVTEMVAQHLTLPDSVRLVILGGEKALFDRFILWQQRVNSSVRLVNSYGPTEATIVTTLTDLSPLPPVALAGQTLPIGQAIQNAQTYVLDGGLQLVPIGIPGELYIGGMGVARGYLNRPDLTATVFIPDPFSHLPGARLYKTGDRVRYRADGSLEFLGRIDHQVKIRGFRIELGEIEALLSQHEAVQESVVIEHADPTGDKCLIAYVVPAASNAPTPQQLRQFLESRLPKYMVPAAFVFLPVLPLSSNGKVDRPQLPTPDLTRSQGATAFIAPRTTTEAEVAQTFAEVLNLEAVGVEDDFFELGGHSLLATKLLARLQSVFPVTLSIVDLFQFPTVAGLATWIEQGLHPLSTPAKSLISPALRRLPRTPGMPIPLSFSQQYIWRTHQASATGATLNSSIVLRITRSLTPTVMEQSWNELIRRHEILRTVFQPVDGQPMQIVLPTLQLPLRYTDLQSYPVEARESLAFNQAIAIAQTPFDLATAPLLRIALWKFSPQEHWLLITMHHLITDGWSFGLLIQELDTLIQAFSQGQPAPLPDVPLQYADFAMWQQQVYDEAAIAQQLHYWQDKLTHQAQPPEPSFLTQPLSSKQAAHYFTQLPESLSSGVESLSRRLGVTNFVVLLAAFKLALAAWSGQQEIWLVTTVGNRTVPGTAQMIGCFINDVILRSHLVPEQSVTTLLQSLQVNVQEAIEHKDVPLEQVIQHTNQMGSCHLMASITITSSTQTMASLPDWEMVELRLQQQQLNEIPSELFSHLIPLEIYVEMAKSIEIIVNYSTELLTIEEVDRWFTLYQHILTALVVRPERPLSEFFHLAASSEITTLSQRKGGNLFSQGGLA